MEQANATLKLSREEMRALGYRVVDMLVEHFDELEKKPVTRLAGRAEMERQFREPLPQAPSDPTELLSRLEQDVFSNIMHPDHPRFFAFVPCPNNFVSAMADALVAGFTIFSGTWLESSGPTQIELVTIDWLRQLFSLPESAGGLFVSGGSVANVTALAAARHVKLGDQINNATVYCSDQTHASIEKGLRVLGFAPGQLRKLPSDDSFRLLMPELRRAVARDRAEGRRPFCVVANAGTTNTGAVDPLPELADFCCEEGLWLHVDGAFGAAAILAEKGRALLDGIDRVDSLSVDPHKWLFQPYEIGCVIVRESRWLKETFHILPEYMKEAGRVEEEVNFCDYGIQLTRSFRGLKLWMSLKVFGLSAFRQAVSRGFELAEFAERCLRELPNWTVVTPAQLGVVTFRATPDGRSPSELNDLQDRLIADMIADGFAMLSATTLRGIRVLRFCTINPRTTEADIRGTIERLDRFSNRYTKVGNHPGGSARRE
jgi:glutamate/tyrosine decarboxylase-like PLP-dependent enzyme